MIKTRDRPEPVKLPLTIRTDLSAQLYLPRHRYATNTILMKKKRFMLKWNSAGRRGGWVAPTK
jgi:hypothetical protein